MDRRGGGTNVAQGALAERRASWWLMTWGGVGGLGFGIRAGGNSGGLAAKQLCVTAQLRGSAFDALNIRTSELFFILRRKVRVSQPGQIAQGKFPFPFVGPPAFMCWDSTS